MGKFFFIWGILCVFGSSGFAQSYGVAFSSHETAFEKRTSLDLTPNSLMCFSNNTELSFDLSFVPGRPSYFGYILRIISKDNQNLDLLYNPRLQHFKVILNDAFTNISFAIDSPKLYKDWNRISLKFNLEKHILNFYSNGKETGSSNLPANFNCFKLLFGANNFNQFKTRDLPAMLMRDIKISENNDLKYFWPLDELSGDTIYDKQSRQVATIENADWLRPKHQSWNLVSRFNIKGFAGVAYDSKHDDLYFVGEDSVGIYSFTSNRNSIGWIPSKLDNLKLGNQAIFDTSSNSLYDFYVDQQKVIKYDFLNGRWEAGFQDGKITEYWHTNKLISERDSSLYIFGGYGQFKFKNQVQRYSLPHKTWEIIPTTGDYFSPRYLAALGVDPTGNYAYIVGGFGSKTGDQMLEPGNYYDMVRFDINKKSFKKILTLAHSGTPYIFGNSLIINEKGNGFYGLIYPSDSSASYIQLIKGSLSDSSYALLGNQIPFNFHDTQSFSDLFYSHLNNKLYVVVLNYTKLEDKVHTTDVKIYTINAPPAPNEILVVARPTNRPNHLLAMLFTGGLAVLVLLFFGMKYFKRRKNKIVTIADRKVLPVDESTDIEAVQRPAIYFFGQFQAFDKAGYDITKLFTPLIKELFFIITINTFRNSRGISSQGLDEILWHDKPEKDAKNNRAVNITKLKTILEKIGNCTINKESGLWQFKILDESIYLDYSAYVKLPKKGSAINKEQIHCLVNIIKRGAFLDQAEYSWLDTFKAEISNSIIDICVDYCSHQDLSKDSEFIIEIANCIFYFDQLNEYALIYKCKSLILMKRHSLANKTFTKFEKDFMEIYGENFQKSFQEIIA